jgi:hypothetical protein
MGLEQILTFRCPKVRVPFLVTLRNLHFSHSVLNFAEQRVIISLYIINTCLYIGTRRYEINLFTEFRRMSSFKGKDLLFLIWAPISYAASTSLISASSYRIRKKHISFIYVLCIQYFKYSATSAIYQTIKRR